MPNYRCVGSAIVCGEGGEEREERANEGMEKQRLGWQAFEASALYSGTGTGSKRNICTRQGKALSDSSFYGVRLTLRMHLSSYSHLLDIN